MKRKILYNKTLVFKDKNQEFIRKCAILKNLIVIFSIILNLLVLKNIN